MRISEGEQNKIITLHYERKHNEIMKILLKMYNGNYEDILDKHFILKNICLISKKIEDAKLCESDRDYTISKYYFNKAYENIEPFKYNYLAKYYEIVWLKLSLYDKEISNKDKILIYEDMYEYYKNIKYKRNEIAILINIYKLQNRISEIPSLIYEIDDFEDSDINDMIRDILQECRTFGGTYYNEAINIITNSKIGNYITL